MIFHEFEKCFVRLLALDRTVLYMSKVVSFLKVVDVQDREKVGLLLENDDSVAQEFASKKSSTINLETHMTHHRSAP